MDPAKPAEVFDREAEWRALARFTSRTGRSQLGIVSGRRRQGKTFLLESLTRATGGFYFGAQQATQAESLRRFASALASWLDLPAPPRLEDWNDAVAYLFSVDKAAKGPVVIDEFPYLVGDAPELPSVLQHAFDRTASDGKGPSILLCGSAMAVMGRLLGGNAPLRGRANLELVVRPFDFPLARRFWRLSDPRLAVLVNAVVGGTPAYRRFINEDSPRDLADFDDWILRNILDVTSPLFREARYLLDEEANVRDSALYHSVLAAVANGNNTRGGIANYIGRRSADIGHHLNVLEDSHLLRRDPDILRTGRSTYRVAEPLVTFYQVVMRPEWSRLETGHAGSVWKNGRARFLSQVVGPHFEQLCREWTLAHADEPVGEVGASSLTDPAAKTQLEVDVIALAPADHGVKRRVVAVGEAKWGATVGPHHVQRLSRAIELLDERGLDVTDTKILCFGGSGSDPGIADSERVRCVDLDELVN